MCYPGVMKKRDLEKILKNLGFWLVQGSKHDKWTDGIDSIAVPRHQEINEFTAKGIIKQAEAIVKIGGKK